ncbi:MAG: TetR/AcrR family transcriptional regulator [Mogibacterium sp.]|nr:TetR/AcrR family transcriptional regulator [Mogibacterium sp.]
MTSSISTDAKERNDFKDKREDRRVAKTKKSIRVAFTKLLAEKDFNTITVTDIAKEADINRKTFYNYYTCISDVHDEIEDNIVQGYVNVLKDADFRDILTNPRDTVIKLHNSMEDFFDLYGNVVKINRNGHLVDKIVDTMTEEVSAIIMEQTNADKAKASTICQFILAGTINVYRQWFRNGQKEPIDEIFDFIGTMASAALASVM